MSTSGKLRSMATVYLTCGDQILLLYRQGSSVVADSWVGSAGGHFVPEELCNARACVLREMREELGLEEAQLVGLSLRYIVLRRAEKEIRQNYYFFAELPGGTELSLHSTEGTLKWVSQSALFNYEMPVTAKQMLEHWRGRGRYTNEVYGGVTDGKNGTFTEITLF